MRLTGIKAVLVVVILTDNHYIIVYRWRISLKKRKFWSKYEKKNTDTDPQLLVLIRKRSIIEKK